MARARAAAVARAAVARAAGAMAMAAGAMARAAGAMATAAGARGARAATVAVTVAETDTCTLASRYRRRCWMKTIGSSPGPR